MELASFLLSKREAGHWDSSGEFTMACDKALRKTASYSFTDPKHWILKVIQAAVALECDQVQVFLCRRVIRVELSGGKALSLSGFAEHLHAPVRPSTDAESELFLGLKSLLKGQTFAIQDASGKRFLWHKEKLSEASGSNLAGARNITLLVARQTKARSWVARSASSARESQAYEELLSSRALFAPLKLTCDGREISPGQIRKRYLCASTPHESPGSPVHLLSLDLGSGERLREMSSQGLFRDSLRSREPFMKVRSESGRAMTSFQLFLSYGCRGQLTNGPDRRPGFKVSFGRLGVVCHTQTCSDTPCGGVAFHELGAKCGDLSGLQLEPTSQDWAYHRQMGEQFEPELEKLRNEIIAHESGLHAGDFSRFEFGVLGVVGGALAATVCYPFLGVFGAKALLIGTGLGTLSAGSLSVNSVRKLSRSVQQDWALAIEVFQNSSNWRDPDCFRPESS
jgi:hypothetical protein